MTLNYTAAVGFFDPLFPSYLHVHDPDCLYRVNPGA